MPAGHSVLLEFHSVACMLLSRSKSALEFQHQAKQRVCCSGQDRVWCSLCRHADLQGMSIGACHCMPVGSTQQHWPFPGHGQEETGYAYIMTHPGMPTVMWEHYFDYGLGGCIKHLIDVRYLAACTPHMACECCRMTVIMQSRYDTGYLACLCSLHL